jgi:hypothetical protein
MKILKNAGVMPSDYKSRSRADLPRGKAMVESKENTASTLNPPYSFEAATAGLKSMGRAIDLIGPYQASSAFAMRTWVANNGPLLERYIAGYIEALRWATDPANREATTALLADKLKLSPDLAAKTYAAVVDPRFGETPDAKLDVEGLRNVLAIRANSPGNGAAAFAGQVRRVRAVFARCAHQIRNARVWTIGSGNDQGGAPAHDRGMGAGACRWRVCGDVDDCLRPGSCPCRAVGWRQTGRSGASSRSAVRYENFHELPRQADRGCQHHRDREYQKEGEKLSA